MKSTRIFFFWVVVFSICPFVFDYLKGGIFLVNHHFLMVKLKTYSFMFGAVVLMIYTLDINSFKRFAIFYLTLFIVFFALKYLSIEMSIIHLPNEYIYTNEILLNYLNIIQLFTPLPLIFFWVLNRIYFVNRIRE
jgi:hypothetical protein